MATSDRTLVVVATYNEMENLPRLVDEIFRLAGEVDILVVDDNSPDGTGRWCQQRAADEPRLRCLIRPGKLGLGTAAVAGFEYAIEHGYDLVLTMDADFSHPPEAIPRLLAAAAAQPPPDVVIGSRYVPGGRIVGWPWYRRWMSRAMNQYARWLLGLRPRDCTGAFRCYRVDVLRQVLQRPLRSRGYSYLEEILWRLQRRGARMVEVPIVFVDRQAGQTKINYREALAAVWLVLKLAICQRLLQRP